MLNVILALLAVRSFLNNVWIFHACKKLHYRYRPSPATLRPDRQITILLPVLQEAAIIERAVRYIEVCREGLGQVELYIIGTARERDESGTNPTLEHAEASARQLGRVHIIEAPRTDGWMVHQLNYAFSHLIATSRHPRKEWIFLINVDSQFSREGLEEMIGYINQGVPVLHQCAVFLSNFAALRAPLKAFALWQSRWTLAHELKRFALNRKCSYALMHVVGHGLCINLDTVSRYNGFPEETLTEDLHFGFYLAAAGEKVVSLRTIEMADHPTTLTDVFRQKYVWSFGPMLYIRYLQAFRRKFPAKWRANRIRPIVLTLQGLLSFL
ncbi:MAG TPA: glycosyltransferase, partial [Longimicrobium sp.]